MNEPPKERSDFGSLRLRGRIWWLRYRVDGQEHWETSRSTSRRVAEKMLAQRQAEFGLGLLTAPAARRIGFSDLVDLLRDHYRNRKLKSLDRAERAIKRLGETFDGMRAHAITVDAITKYETARLGNGAARATVNYELSVLRKAFNLAVRARLLPNRPPISTPSAHNARTGFFEPDDFAAVIDQLPAPLKPVFRFAYFTGWRVRSEILPLTWDRVDFAGGVVRLEPNTTKTNAGRTFPFNALHELTALLTTQREETRTLERSTGQVIRYVFHRNGRPIKSYYRAWEKACEAASTSKAADRPGVVAVIRPQLLDRVAHDFRRTAVRNLVRAGVSERVAMELCGHKTRAIFDRYDIVNEADLRAGVAKLATHLTGSDGHSSKPRRGSKGTKGGHSPRRAGGEIA